MRLTHAILAIFDISGYTAFIRHRTVTLLHAEQIVTDLLESVVERAEHPLLLNKFEGDAALLWTAVDADPASVARSVLMQARQAFEAFSGRLDLIRGERSHCSCAACANIASLQLKVLLHSGEIAIKQVRQFEELAGEPVIALHRLLKKLRTDKETKHKHIVVLMDNATIHKHSSIYETARRFKVNVLLNAQYSPWLNPVE
jgi:hypothetical protein